MTLCVGWIHGDRVLLVGDTLATTRRDFPSRNAVTAFGESTEMLRGSFCDDKALKLIPIHEHAAVAIAGNVAFAIEIVEFIKENIDFAHATADSFAMLDATFGAGQAHYQVELLIAWHDTLGPHLLRWTTAGHMDIAEFGAAIGQTDGWQLAALWKVVQFVDKQQVLWDRAVAIVGGLLRSMANIDALAQQGVGGAVVGLGVGSDGVSWQPDTHYCILHGDGQFFGHVSTLVRDHVLAVRGSLRGDTALLSTSVSCKDLDHWFEIWGERVDSVFSSGESEFNVFMNTAAHSVVLIVCPKRIPGGKYMRREVTPEGFQLELAPGLIRLLLDPPPKDGPAGMIPLRVWHFVD